MLWVRRTGAGHKGAKCVLFQPIPKPRAQDPSAGLRRMECAACWRALAGDDEHATVILGLCVDQKIQEGLSRSGLRVAMKVDYGVNRHTASAHMPVLARVARLEQILAFC